MTYNSAEEICYTPEKAVEWSVQAAREIEDHVKKLDVYSSAKLRSKDVWLRDIKNFKEQTLPRTLIAVCGATGAGKSSLINALLEDNIVPTSSVRACTAVATEVSYHDKNTIEAKIEFITWDEWRHELEALTHDLTTTRRGDAGSLWQKIHAIYPRLTVEDFVTTSPDDIIRSNQQVADLLGTSDEVKSPNSVDFSFKIARYIDPPKRIVTAAVTGQEDPETPLWPLIRVVQVVVKADVLKSGATLVDLPGLGDSNLARCNVANEYIKKCDYIWIVSNIQRAVDGGIARNLQDDFFKAQIMNGHYNGNRISFVMTKSDELDPDDIIRGMRLGSLPDFVELEAQIDCASQEKGEHDAIVKEVRVEIQKTIAHITELESDINKYKVRLSPTRIKTEQPPDSLESEATNPISRKRQHEPESHPNKRARADPELAAASQGEAGHSMDLDEPEIQDSTRNSTQATWKAFIDRKERNLAHSNEQLQHFGVVHRSLRSWHDRY